MLDRAELRNIERCSSIIFNERAMSKLQIVASILLSDSSFLNFDLNFDKIIFACPSSLDGGAR